MALPGAPVDAGQGEPRRYTARTVRATVEPLEGNKVKVSVEVDESEVEKAIDAAFRRIAHEVRLPGFRPGKAPRRLLEARMGTEYARQEALKEAIPSYYAQAVVEHEVDVIAPPEVDITAGQESGPVAFDAVVEVRPRILVPGYGGLRAEIPSPVPTDADVDERVDILRRQFSSLGEVDRPAADGDHVTIDITGSRDGEALAGLVATDYLYEVGSGMVVPELDDHLRGASAGQSVEFSAQHPDPDEERIDFAVAVSKVSERVLPEVTDEWVAENTEFATVAELRADIANRMRVVKLVQANVALRNKTAEALSQLVEEDAPETLVTIELRSRINDMVMRLQAQGLTVEQYLAATGRDAAAFTEELRVAATEAVKVDLALRAVADAEGIEAEEEDLEAEYARLAPRMGAKAKPRDVKRQFERNGTVMDLKADLRKRKALEWLVERVEVVDTEGHPVERSALAPPAEARAEVDAAVGDAVAERTATTTPDMADEGDVE